MQILCRVIGHRRSKRRITQWRETWQTECILCSTRLVRVRQGKWVPISAFRKKRFRVFPVRQAD